MKMRARTRSQLAFAGETEDSLLRALADHCDPEHVKACCGSERGAEQWQERRDRITKEIATIRGQLGPTVRQEGEP